MSPLARDVSRVPRTQLDVLMELVRGAQSVAPAATTEVIIDHDPVRPRRPPRNVPVSPAHLEPVRLIDEVHAPFTAPIPHDSQNFTTTSTEDTKSVNTDTTDSDSVANNDTSSTTSHAQEESTHSAHSEYIETASEPDINDNTSEQHSEASSGPLSQHEPQSDYPNELQNEPQSESQNEPQSLQNDNEQSDTQSEPSTDSKTESEERSGAISPTSSTSTSHRRHIRRHTDAADNTPQRSSTRTLRHQHVPSPKLYRSNTAILPPTGRSIVSHKSFHSITTPSEDFTNIVLKPVARRPADVPWSPTRIPALNLNNNNDGTGSDSSRPPISPRGGPEKSPRGAPEKDPATAGSNGTGKPARIDGIELHRGKSESHLQNAEDLQATAREMEATRARSNSSPMKVIMSTQGIPSIARALSPPPTSALPPLSPTSPTSALPPIPPSTSPIPILSTSGSITTGSARSRATPPTTPTYGSTKPNVSFSLPPDKEKEGKPPTPTKREGPSRGNSLNGLNAEADQGITKRENLRESNDSTRTIQVPIRIEPVPGIVRDESNESLSTSFSSSKSSSIKSSSDTDSIKSSSESLKTSSDSLKNSSEAPPQKEGTSRRIQLISDIAKLFGRGSDTITHRSTPDLPSSTAAADAHRASLTRKMSVDANMASKDAQQQKKVREELLTRKRSTDSIPPGGISKSAEYSTKELSGKPAVPPRRKGEKDSSPVFSASGALLTVPGSEEKKEKEKEKESGARRLFFRSSADK